MVYNSPMVLIVDDEEEICKLVSEGLIEDGYTCEIVSTADEALAKFQNHQFNIALLDINLPGKSGIELLKSFQTLSQNTSVVMMTAVRDLDTVIEAMKLGASDYIVKPFTINKLRASIGTVMESSKRHSSFSDIIQPTGTLNRDISKTANRPFDTIKAIAYGVDYQIDYFDFHSKIVTEKTIDFARQLCLPENEIENWAFTRHELYSERNRYIESVLNKLEQSPIAQVMLGMTYSVYDFPGRREE